MNEWFGSNDLVPMPLPLIVKQDTQDMKPAPRRSSNGVQIHPISWSNSFQFTLCGCQEVQPCWTITYTKKSHHSIHAFKITKAFRQAHALAPSSHPTGKFRWTDGKPPINTKPIESVKEHPWENQSFMPINVCLRKLALTCTQWPTAEAQNLCAPFLFSKFILKPCTLQFPSNRVLTCTRRMALTQIIKDFWHEEHASYLRWCFASFSIDRWP